MVVDPYQSSPASIKAAIASLVLPPVVAASSPLMARLQPERMSAAAKAAIDR